MDLQAGGKLGGYEIIAPIGEGGMGTVWRARDEKLGRQIAIKVVKADDPSGRLLHEARAAARVNHPNVVTVHEVGEHEGYVFLVMELVDGRPLGEGIPRGGMPLRKALEYAIPIARALEAAHKLGIVHRDLKPANVMVTTDGAVKLLDFGLAKDVALPATLDSNVETKTALANPETEEGRVAGTIAYMSPEQAQGKALDGRTDIFSFGTLFYEMLTGRRPFDRENKLSTLAAILREEPAPIDRRLPESVERLAMRCLRKDPNRRFQTGADLRAALEDLKDESESSATVPRSVPRRRIKPAIAASIAAIAAIAALIVWPPWRSAPAPALSAPVQITYEGGVAATPAISADGKLFAFASDKSEPGNLDIWLRQMRGGAPVRLTSLAAQEYNPQFSSDGTRLYYLSKDREIEEMPTLGGPARKIIGEAGPFTVSARNEIAFMRHMPAGLPGPMFLAPVSGGAAESWHPECAATSRPVWSADGSELFFFGQCGGGEPGGHLAPRSGKVMRISDALGTPAQAVKAGSFPRELLFPTPRGILRAARDGSVNLTASPVNQTDAVIDASGNVMFSNSEFNMSIWRMGGGGESAAPQEMVAGIGHFGVSRDGSVLVYGRMVSQQSGELVARNLRTGDERVFAAPELLNAGHGSIWPQVSPDAKRVFYRLAPGNRGGEIGHFVLHLETGDVKKVAGIEDFQLASDWSADGKRVLGECPAPRFGICEVDPESGSVRKVFVHASDQLLYPSQSWDGKWMTFARRKPGGIASIWIARMTADGFEPEERWSQISPPETDNSRPRFSPTGGLVYYILGHDGMRQFAIQKVDTRTGAATGPASFPLKRPIELTALTGGGGPYPLISVTGSTVYYSSKALRGNIWLARLK
jgi:predicted Ser/Thr protein kinase